jgi:replicative DNA helicase
MSDRIPPYSEEAEKASLGSMLLDPLRVVAFAQGVLRIKPVDFYVPANARLCEIIFGMVAEGRPVDLMTIGDKLTNLGRLEEIGGNIYLERLIESTPTSAHAEYYLDIVRQKAIQRRTISVASEIVDRAYREERGDALVQEAPQMFVEILDAAVKAEEPNSVVLARSIEGWEEAKRLRESGEKRVLAGLPFPWESVNNITCGIQLGLTVIAGRPSEGKTTLEDNVMTGLALEGIPVARITCDMNRKRLLERAACRMAGVSLPKLKRGFATHAQILQVRDAMKIIEKLPIYINDCDRDLRSLCTWIRAEKMRHGIQAVSIDYMQLIDVSVDRGKYINDQEKVSRVSATIKALSFELEIPMIGLSQLSRAMFGKERGKNAIPRLSDLRGSGSIEQDGTLIIFVYRDPEVPEKEHPKTTPTWVDIQKQQDGDTGAIPFWFYREYFKFEEAPPNFGVDEAEAEKPKSPKGPKKASAQELLKKFQGDDYVPDPPEDDVD